MLKKTTTWGGSGTLRMVFKYMSYGEGNKHIKKIYYKVNVVKLKVFRERQLFS